MAGTLTVTVTDHGGTVVAGVLVRAYDALGVFGGSATSNGSGVAVVTVAAGTYTVHVEEMNTRVYQPQWVGAHGEGVATQEQAGTFTVADAGNVAIPVRLETDLHLFGEEVDGAPWSFWKDTTAGGTVLRLLPGEERRPFSGDKTDPLYKHVLVGPFTTAAKAAAA